MQDSNELPAFRSLSPLVGTDGNLETQIMRLDDVTIAVGHTGPKLSRYLVIEVDNKRYSTIFQSRESVSGPITKFRWICPTKPKISKSSSVSVYTHEARDTVLKSAFSERKPLRLFRFEGSAVFQTLGLKIGPKHELHDFTVNSGEFSVTAKILMYIKDPRKTQATPAVLTDSLQKLDALLEKIYRSTSMPLIAVTARGSLLRVCEEAAFINEHATQDNASKEMLANAVVFSEALTSLLNHLISPTPLNAHRLQNSDQTLVSVFTHIAEAERLLLQDTPEKPATAEQDGDIERREKRLKYIRANFTTMRRNFDVGKNVQIPLPAASAFATIIEDVTFSDPGLEGRNALSKLKSLLPDRPAGALLLGCHSATRTHQIKEICSWTTRVGNQATSSNIFWLRGSPGTGKTAIARNIIAESQQHHRFGALFTFQSKSNPANAWTDIAYDLCRLHPSLRFSILSALDEVDDPKALNAVTAFRKLVYNPLRLPDISSRFMKNGLVIVIDAVDLCPRTGSADISWRDFLSTIVDWSHLPNHFKLIISSWHLSQIENHLKTASVRYDWLDLMGGDHTLFEDSSDIRRLLDHRLESVLHRQDSPTPSLSAWKTNRDLSILTSFSNGFFFWACEIANKIVTDADQKRQLSIILSEGPAASCDTVDRFYNNILGRCFRSVAPSEWDSLSFRQLSSEFSDLRRLLGFIALTKGTLSIPILRRLLNIEGKPLQEKLLALSPVVHYSTGADSSVVRYRHHSLAEFILNSKRSHDDFAVDPSSLSRDLTSACLRIITDNFKDGVDFLKNESTYRSRPAPKINYGSLAYACRFWTAHLAAISGIPDSELLLQLHYFFENHLLSWFEVLAGLNVAGSATHMLNVVVEWLKAVGTVNLLGFAEDARGFMVRFSEPLSRNIPHIYLSGIAFSEGDSQLFKHYRRNFPSILRASRENRSFYPSHEYSFSSSFIRDTLSRPFILRAAQALLPASTNLAPAASPPSVSCMSLSPFGDKIALGMSDASIYVLKTTTGQPIFTLAGHARPIKSLSYGKQYIVSGDSYGLILLWDCQTGSLITPLKQLAFERDSSISCVQLSPDEKRLAFCAEDFTVEILDLTAGAGADVLHTNAKLPGCGQWIRTLAWSTDSTYVVAAGDDTKIYCWNVASGDSRGEALHGHSSYISALAVSSDGKYIASAGADLTIMLWNTNEIDSANEQRYPVVLQGNTSTVCCLAFTPDSRYLLSTSESGILIAWSISRGRQLSANIQAHGSKTSGLAVLPDSGLVVTTGADSDQEVKIWDLSYYLRDDYTEPGPVLDTLPMPDGKVVLSSDGSRIWAWDVASRGPAETTLARLLHMDEKRDDSDPFIFSPDGRLAASANMQAVFVFDLNRSASLPPRKIIPPKTIDPTAISSVAFSPTSDVLAVCNSSSIWLWDIVNKEVTYSASFGRDKGHISAIAASPRDGCVALAWSEDYVVQSIDLSQNMDEQSSYKKGTSSSHLDLVEALAFDGTGSKVASVSRDGTVRVWSAGSNDLVFATRLTRSFPCVLAWSPDSFRFVLGMNDGSVFVLDANTGVTLGGPWRAQSMRVNSVAFTSDGSHVTSASADGTVRMWDTAPHAFTVSERVHRHTDWVSAVAISLDGHRVASGSHDKKLTLYSADSRPRTLATWYAHGDWITCLAFTHDGKTLISGCIDGSVRFWDLPALSDEYQPQPASKLRDPRRASIVCLALAPTDHQLATASENKEGRGVIHVWDLVAEVCIHSLDANDNSTFTALVYSPDGTRLVSASSDGTMCIWDAEEGKKRVGPFSYESEDGSVVPVLSLAFSPSSGDFFLSGGEDGTIRLWDANTGESYGKVPARKAHESRVRCVAIGTGDTRAFSAADDGTVRIWDIKTSGLEPEGFLCTEVVPPLHGHAEPILGLCVSHDGRRFVTSSADCTVAIWRTDPDPKDQRMVEAHATAMSVRDSQGLLGDGVTLDADGWLRAYGGSLQLCWVPPQDRAGLRIPRTRGAFGAGEVTLDGSKFVHGTRWKECYRPVQEAVQSE